MGPTTGPLLDVIGPIAGKTITFVQSALFDNGGVTTVEVRATPFRGDLHYHPRAEERLEVLEGEVAVRVGHETLHVALGEEVVIPCNVLHTWSNESNSAVRVRIRFRPGLGVETYLRTTYGLHRDGKVDSAGRFPILQLAVLSSHYRDMMVFELDP